MKRSLTPAILLLAAVLAVFLVSFQPFHKASSERSFLPAGKLKQAPGFKLPLMPAGQEVLSLDELRQKKPLLLVFWATWCPPCIQEIPVLESWHRNYQDKFSVLAVHVGESQEPLKDFMARQGISYPVVLDRESKTASLYGVSGLPVAVVLDPEGKILYYGFTLPQLQEILASAGV